MSSAKHWVMAAVVTYIALYLAGLAQLPFTDRLTTFKGFIQQGETGSSLDFWLVKCGLLSTGNDDYVALFFGYVDDYEGCLIVANLLKRSTTIKIYTLANGQTEDANWINL